MNLNLKSKLLFLSIIPLLFVIVLSSIILFEFFNNKKNLEHTKYRILEAEAISKINEFSPELILLDKKNAEIKLTMMADSAGIIKFELEENKVHFFVEWNSYPPDDRKTVKYSDIVFIAQQIFWENVPDLYDPLREVKRDRIL